MTPHILCSAPKDGFEAYRCALRAAGGEAEGGYCPALDLSYDGLLLCGGGDIDPARYGQELHGSQPPDPARDETEFNLARAYLEAGKPILGICRGHQLLNVLFGGTLLQDVGETLRLFHSHGENEPDLVHPVRSAPGSFFARAYGSLFPVNSFHHQAADRMGKGLIPTLWSESGLVEAMEHESLPILGVQFHPERMTGKLARIDTVDGAPIFEHFLSFFR